jgi:hypothetical protein
LHLICVHLFLLSIATSPGIIGLPVITLDIFHLTPSVIHPLLFEKTFLKSVHNGSLTMADK